MQMRCESNLRQSVAGNRNKNNETITLGGELPNKTIYVMLKLSQTAFNSKKHAFFSGKTKKRSGETL